MNDSKEIKQNIRLLRKLKKDIPKQTQERREINAKIRALKKKIKDLELPNVIDIEKERIIAEILKCYNYQGKTYMPQKSLRHFTVEQLQHHLNNLRRE